MPSAVRNYARTARRSDGVRVIILPVLSGTPRTVLELLSSDELVEVPVQPGIFREQEEATLVADVASQPLSLQHLTCTLKELLRDKLEARVALPDMGYRPRYLVTLGVLPRQQPNQSVKKASAVEFLDWHAASIEVVKSLSIIQISEVSRYETLARLGLSQAPVRRFLVPLGGMSDAGRFVCLAATEGLVGF